MKSKKRKTYRKRNKKIRIILLNLIVLVLFVIFGLLLLNIFVPITKANFAVYDPEKAYEINLSEDEILELPTVVAEEVYSYGENINITSEALGDSYKLSLYDTTNSEVNYAFNDDSNIDVGINTHDMPVGSFFLQTDDGSFVSYADDLDINFRTITRDGVNNQITVDTVNGLVHITKYEAEANSDELDILVDPGHGGEDGGSSSNDGTILEKDLNLELATLIANDLSDMGYNVGLTRTEDINPGTCEDNISSYCPDGRVSQAYNDNAKLVLSIHHNTGGAQGFEVYTSYYGSETLANQIVGTLSEVSNISSKELGYISDGVYKQVFEDDTDPSIEQDYMYMIRETGGIATNSLSEENEANNTEIQGSQALLIEFGYLDDDADLAHVSDSTVMEQEAYAVSNAVDSYLNGTSTMIDLAAEEE